MVRLISRRIFTRKFILTNAAIGSVLVWLILLTVDLYHVLFGLEQRIVLNPYIREALLSLFIFLVFSYFKFSLDRKPATNYLRVLKAVLSIGVGATVTIIVINGIYFLVGKNHAWLFLELTYHINLGLGIVFICNTFFAWKKLVLYHKSIFLVRAWRVFEYSLLIMLLVNIARIPISYHVVYYTLALTLIGLAVFLSFHVRWIAYLPTDQKFNTLLLIFLIIIDLFYFLFTILNNEKNNYLISIDIIDNLFLWIGFVFVSFYAVLSLLVLIFNLPTSSVFEQKINQLVAFQRLNQSIQVGEYVYDFLFESAASAAFADAAWLEVYDSKGYVENLFTKNVLKRNVELIKHTILKSDFKSAFKLYHQKGIDREKIGRYSHSLPFESILIVPVYVNGNQVACLVLLKDVRYGFSKEMIDMVNALVEQAKISITNFRLLPETILRERYKEELEIAKRVQKKLLPEHFVNNEFYEIAAFTQSADQVGGDYYDFYQISPHRTLFVIGDVSGKGTSAAFNMAQMKGIFQALAQLDLDPKSFLAKANHALGNCLEKSSFITLTLFLVDTSIKKIMLVRGGHCPALYYKDNTKQVEFLRSKGMGLGIVLDDTFSTHIDLVELDFEPHDQLLFYTDGITEARNKTGDEYGFDRLKLFMQNNHTKEPKRTVNALIESVFDFCQGASIEDDYTIFLIKF